jgi:hypothetical protein
MAKKSAPTPLKSEEQVIREMVALESDIRSHIIGLNRAIAKLGSPEEIQAVKRDIVQFLQSGIIPPSGWLG